MGVHMSRVACLGLVVIALGWARPAMAQDDAVQAELDAFWAEVVRTVVEWDFEGQQATYHPDAISVMGDSVSYTTRLMSAVFAEAESEARTNPPSNPGLAFRWSSRVHDETTAHEVGLYRFSADGREDFYGGAESYLVKKDGRWTIMVEIQRGEGVSKSEWDALGR